MVVLFWYENWFFVVLLLHLQVGGRFIRQSIFDQIELYAIGMTIGFSSSFSINWI